MKRHPGKTYRFFRRRIARSIQRTRRWPAGPLIVVSIVLLASLAATAPALIKLADLHLPAWLRAWETSANWGQWLSGIFAPIATIIAIRIYNAQREELALTRRELAASSRALADQALEQKTHSDLIAQQIAQQTAATIASTALAKATALDRLGSACQRFDEQARRFAWAINDFSDPDRAIVDVAYYLEGINEHAAKKNQPAVDGYLRRLVLARVRSSDINDFLIAAGRIEAEAKDIDLHEPFAFDTKRLLRAFRDGKASEALRQLVEIPVNEGREQQVPAVVKRVV